MAQSALLEKYDSLKELDTSKTINVFVTGGTGFLGSFIIRDILTSRPNQSFKIYAHVRASSKEAGLERLRKAGLTYGIWQDEWSKNIEVVLGDLSKPQFGLDDTDSVSYTHLDVYKRQEFTVSGLPYWIIY